MPASPAAAPNVALDVLIACSGSPKANRKESPSKPKVSAALNSHHRAEVAAGRSGASSSFRTSDASTGFFGAAGGLLGLAPPVASGFVMVAMGSSDLAVGEFNEAGYESYLVGGCVRDHLLGREPTDYDIVTSARPEDIRRLFDRTFETGAVFGVMNVVIGGRAFEVATFRADGEYSNGRRPDRVTFTTRDEDVRRRDFTVNGLLETAGGEIIDLVGGRKDLQSRLIRAIGDAERRFEEDSLRPLRAVRLAATLDFDIEAGTFEAIGRAAASVSRVSAERIFTELDKSFSASPLRTLELLDETELLPVVLPEVQALKAAEGRGGAPIKSAFQTTCRVLDNLPASHGSAMAWAGLLHDLTVPGDKTKAKRKLTEGERKARAAVAVLSRLKSPGGLRNGVRGLVLGLDRIRRMDDARPSAVRRLVGEPRGRERLLFARAAIEAGGESLKGLERCEEELAGHPDGLPEPLVTGDDLLKRGFESGRALGEALAAAYDAQLEGAGRDEALKTALRYLELIRK